MPFEVKHISQVDTGTGTVEPQREQTVDLSAESEGPTGAAESTLVREVKAEEHLDEPTGVSEPARSTTTTADWPKVQESEQRTAESKTTAKKTVSKTTKKKS